MTEKRFKVTQNRDLFTVRDTVENKVMGVFEFKENEFPVYVCFMKIIDKMNELNDENEQLKQRNENQYNQLKQLWELIEKEDYNTLRSMLNQRETDEKLLQNEWRTYCD